MMERRATKRLPRKHAKEVLAALKAAFPKVSCTLDHLNPFQLVVATILSAQCTDRRVNMVTGPLFERFPSPESFAKAELSEIEEAIKSTGFYHNKARNIQNLCRVLIEQYDGEVPQTMDELTQLPGVGRKTANVVLGNAFGINSGFVVDTHVLRLSQRLGLTQETTPEKVEYDLVELFPPDEWIDTSHRLIQLGRTSCKAQHPQCYECSLAHCCPQYVK